MIEIDFSKLSKSDPPTKEDLLYLYLELNLSKSEISPILSISIFKLDKFLKLYQIEKSHELWDLQRKRVYLEKYGTDNPSKRENFKEILKESNLKKYGVSSTNQLQFVKDKKKETCQKNFGVENPSQSKKVQQKKIETFLSRYSKTSYNNPEQTKKTCLKRYGVSNCSKVADFVEKKKKTCLERYGSENFMKSKFGKSKHRKNFLSKYGVSNPSKLDVIKEKKYQTKKKNHTFNSSKIELEILTLLKTKFPDVKSQYKDPRYPFACDFYIPSLDLFLEFQGTWTHGGHPFDETNPKDLELLELWKKKSEELNQRNQRKVFYLAAIETWTIRDPLKRKISKENNLNFKEFFSKKEFEDWFKELKRG